jgi:hypothetical protein
VAVAATAVAVVAVAVAAAAVVAIAGSARTDFASRSPTKLTTKAHKDGALASAARRFYFWLVKWCW